MRAIRDRRIFCGWCGTDVKDGHADSCHMKPAPRKGPELQPCGHPVESIRSSPYIGKEASNRCGWCEDVARLQGALQPLLDEIGTGGDLDYHLRTEGHAERLQAALSTPADRFECSNDELASLRALIDEARAARDSSHAQLQALHVRVIDIHNQAVMELPSTTDTTRDVLKWIIAKANVDISIENSDGWLQRHDAEVRAQEREQCAGVCFLRAEELARRTAFEQYGNQRRERDIRGREATRCGSVIRNGEADDDTCV